MNIYNNEAPSIASDEDGFPPPISCNIFFLSDLTLHYLTLIYTVNIRDLNKLTNNIETGSSTSFKLFVVK